MPAPRRPPLQPSTAMCNQSHRLGSCWRGVYTHVGSGGISDGGGKWKGDKNRGEQEGGRQERTERKQRGTARARSRQNAAGRREAREAGREERRRERLGGVRRASKQAGSRRGRCLVNFRHEGLAPGHAAPAPTPASPTDRREGRRARCHGRAHSGSRRPPPAGSGASPAVPHGWAQRRGE